MTRRLSPLHLFFFILICLIWGSTWYVISFGLKSGIPPFRGAGFRFLLVTLVLLVVVVIRRPPLPGWKQLKAPLFLGVFYFFVPYSCMYWSENHIPSALAGVIYGSLPLGVMLFSHFMLQGEKITKWKLASAIVGITGLVVIFLAKATQAESQELHAMGVAAMVVALISTSYCTSYTKRHVAHHDLFLFLGIQTLVGGVLMIAVSLVYERPFTLSMEPGGLFSVLYLAIIGTVIAWSLWFHLISKLSPVVVSYNSFLIPLVALVVGTTIGGERFTWLAIVGTVLVLASVLMVIRTMRPEPEKPPA